MNMNKALQKLYKAISKEDNHKVNISKLLVDIHYALTGKVPINKNNHARIISELADNWSDGGGGGGGSSDFSTATVRVVANGSGYNLAIPHIVETPSDALVGNVGAMGEGSIDVVTVPMYKGQCVISPDVAVETSGNIQDVGSGFYIITGDGTITIS